MREIKFRAWDKEEKQMLSVGEISFSGEEIETYEYQGDWIGFNHIELMQYTGLKDRNGTEIYEGDVIGFYDCANTENGSYEQSCIGVVEWCEETASFEVSNRLSAESYEVIEDCVVIGNIYENMELLK